MLKVGIIGATGYTGEELVRILSGHPRAKLTSLSAIVDKEEPISKIFPRLKGKIGLICKKPDTERDIDAVDLVFLALPHRVSMEVAPKFLSRGKRVIDLSADYRLPAQIYKIWYGVEHKDDENLKKAVYGLPELYMLQIKKADLIANPGCYPTSVILALAPLLKDGVVETDYIIVDTKSGVTGAGRKGVLSLSFGEVNENMKPYKINEHQHKPEIDKILSSIAGHPIDVVFVPHLMSISRGILSTIYLRLKKKISQDEILSNYMEFYRDKPFVRVMGDGDIPQLRNVFMTNYCDIGIKATEANVVVVSCIDNLGKGAAGQAVQNMNLLCGFNETDGLV